MRSVALRVNLTVRVPGERVGCLALNGRMAAEVIAPAPIRMLACKRRGLCRLRLGKPRFHGRAGWSQSLHVITDHQQLCEIRAGNLAARRLVSCFPLDG